MGIAQMVATRSTCARAQVGCVIVRERRILTTGYNGSPAGLPHCTEVGHLIVNDHCIRTLHAEQNAIIQAALHGISTRGAILYVTHQPCYHCAKMIINSGIRHVMHGGEYRDAASLALLDAAGIAHTQIPKITVAHLQNAPR